MTARTNLGLPDGMQHNLRERMHEANLHAIKTVQEGKGGPFGAGLFLVNPGKNEIIGINNPDGSLYSSNAVLIKGIGSAHAEAENLSAHNMRAAQQFLRRHRKEGWEVVQLSTGESCPACRAKQILFANTLINDKLIAPGKFHVIFEASYEQTFRDAGFYDAPYDTTFRAIHDLDILKESGGLTRMEGRLKADPVTAAMIKKGELIYVPVDEYTDSIAKLPESLFVIYAYTQPAAFVVDPKTGDIMGFSHDRHTNATAPLNQPIVRALQDAMLKQRAKGIFESWNLHGARIYTSVQSIGPLSLAEAQWANIGGITILRHPNFEDPKFRQASYEDPIRSNDSFLKAAVSPYNQPGGTPIRTSYIGHSQDINPAHAHWMARRITEQSETRLRNGGKGQPSSVCIFNGSSLAAYTGHATTGRSSDYNGVKEHQLKNGTAAPAKANAPAP